MIETVIRRVSHRAIEINCILYEQSALNVDVTSLVNKSTCRRHPIAVVVSNVTRSRDMVKMVVHKLGMDHQDVLLVQLVAVVNYRSHQMDDDDGKPLKPCSWS